MKTTILIPHFRTPKITAYSVAQFLKYKGKHEVDIIVINNSWGDDSIKSLDRFGDQITILHNTNTNQISSHGTALDMAVLHVKSDTFIAAESDSFPTHDKWLDYYEDTMLDGFDMAGSHLQLSGGSYIHPCGAIYKTSLWHEIKAYINRIPYEYLPNAGMKEGFACHLMIRTILKRLNHTRTLPNQK